MHWHGPLSKLLYCGAIAVSVCAGRSLATAQESSLPSGGTRDAEAARMGKMKVEPINSGAPADLLVLHKVRTQMDQPGNLAFVDSVSGKVVARVPLGREPHEVAASWDGKWAVATMTGANTNPGNTLAVIDLRTRKEFRRVDLGALYSPHGIWYNNGLFYFTAEGSKAIAAYDPERDHVTWLMGTGQDITHNIVVSRDGKTIFTANRGSHTVSMFELVGAPGTYGAWRVTTISVCRGPQGLDLSPDGKEVWAGCRGSGEIAVIGAAERKVIATFNTHIPQLARVRFTPDGKRVLLAGIANGEITFWDAAERRELKRIKLGSYAEGILITPDGKRAFIGVTTDDNVAELDMTAMTVTRRLRTGQGPDGMAWIGAR